MTMEIRERHHPMDHVLRDERMPHIWCPGCGLGTDTSAFLDAVESLGLDEDKVVIVSGIGCAGRVAGYLKFDSFHTTHGRALPFAIGLKLTNPDLHVVVISGDGDLASIGGNHLIHAARRNIDITVICINNFTYGMTGGQVGPTTPIGAKTTTSVYGNVEHPFNLVHLVAASGAVYVARWTSMHIHHVRNAIRDAISRKGFTFVEIVSACPTNYGRRNKLGKNNELLKYLLEHSVIEHDPDPKSAEIQIGSPIICGTFVDKYRPEFLELMNKHMSEHFGCEVDIRGDGKGRGLTEVRAVRRRTMRREKKPADLEGRVEIKLAGIGGQGIGLSGRILGMAAAIYGGMNAVYTQEYSPEARGGASSSSIIISGEEIDMPYVKKPDIFVLMAQAAMNKYIDEIKVPSLLFVDSDLVEVPVLPQGVRVLRIPATRLAEQLGRTIVANIVMLGFVSANTDVVSVNDVKKALLSVVPKGTEEFNLKAFELGYKYRPEE